MLLEVKNLSIWFGDRERPVRAVDGVSLNIAAGSTVALVGESGSGKSVTSLALARLLDEPPAIYAGGDVVFEGRRVFALGRRDLQRLRGAGISYVFQDPSSSLNPVLTIGAQVRESLYLHRPQDDTRANALQLLERVGLPDPAARFEAYPHQLSGGQKQRVAIAMALACRPRLLVADEPTTALDVTVQAQILARLVALQRETGMAVLFITHNLGLVAGLADVVYVMYAGRIVEYGATEDVLSTPGHPYTRGLLDAVPRLARAPGDVVTRLAGIPGRVPQAAHLPPGCKFNPRCPRRAERCDQTEPGLEGTAWAVRCWYPLVSETSARASRGMR